MGDEVERRKPYDPTALAYLAGLELGIRPSGRVFKRVRSVHVTNDGEVTLTEEETYTEFD